MQEMREETDSRTHHEETHDDEAQEETRMCTLWKRKLFGDTRVEQSHCEGACLKVILVPISSDPRFFPIQDFFHPRFFSIQDFF